jgi:hypothetical protein
MVPVDSGKPSIPGMNKMERFVRTITRLPSFRAPVTS